MKNGKYELIVPPDEYPGKRYRGRYAYEHRVNWWVDNGKNPDDFPSHIIHHKNDKKRDNIPTNLVLMDAVVHIRHHARPKMMNSWKCKNCGVVFRYRANGHEHKFCSRKCMGMYGSNKGTFRRKKMESLVCSR